MEGASKHARLQARIWHLSILIALVALAFLAGCGSTKASGGSEQMPPLPVKLETAKALSISDSTDYVATLKSRESAVISPQVEGYVVQIHVHSGDQVASGAPLMQIDPLKQQATVRSQEDAHAAQKANAVYAKQQFERTQKLYESGVVSKQELDSAKAAVDAAEAQLRSLEAQVHEQQVQLHYYRVVAPWAGIVGDIPVRVGDRVTTTTQLTTVDRPGSLEAYVEVPIERSGQLKMGMPLEIVDGAGKVLAASKVDFISPEVNFQTQMVLLKSRIPNDKGTLRTAQFIRARVIWGTHQGPVIPVLAVVRINGQDFAFVAEGSDSALVARQRQVKLGDMMGNDYVVLDGIKPGDRVVVSGTQLLVDGTKIAPQS